MARTRRSAAGRRSGPGRQPETSGGIGGHRAALCAASRSGYSGSPHATSVGRVEPRQSTTLHRLHQYQRRLWRLPGGAGGRDVSRTAKNGARQTARRCRTSVAPLRSHDRRAREHPAGAGHLCGGSLAARPVASGRAGVVCRGRCVHQPHSCRRSGAAGVPRLAAGCGESRVQRGGRIRHEDGGLF